MLEVPPAQVAVVGALPVTTRDPPSTRVGPEYVLLPDNVRAPEPSLVIPPLPEMTPENVVLVLFEPTAKTELAGTPTDPEPASEPITLDA
jgi:hypothetical protein